MKYLVSNFMLGVVLALPVVVFARSDQTAGQSVPGLLRWVQYRSYVSNVQDGMFAGLYGQWPGGVLHGLR